MGLSLVVGPAHVGKVALLLERYLDVLEREPWLVVPNRIDVDRVERDLVQRRPALLAGTVGTFDDLFRHLAGVDPSGPGVASEIQRTLAARRAVAQVDLGDLGASAATAGFADTLLQTIAELESALVELESLGRELFELVVAYRNELGALGLQDRDGVRRLAVERLRSDLDAWSGAPVFAYGFEDLTGAEWALLEALSARTDVTVSIPYEPGRAAFEALERTVEDLAALADGSIEELPRARAGTPSSPGARAPRARAVRRRAGRRAAARRRDPLPRGCRDAGDGRAPRERGRRAAARRSRGRARRDRLRLARALARAARRCAVAAPRAVRGRARPPSRRHGDRSRAALAAAVRVARRGRAATCSRSCARRSRGSSVDRSTSWKDGSVGARSPSRIASTRRASACVERTSLRSSGLRAADDPSRRVRELVRVDGAKRLGPRVAARRRRRSCSTLAPIASPSARSTSCRRSPSAASRSREEDVVAALERTWVAPESPSTGRVAVLDHEHARTRCVRRRVRSRPRGGSVPASGRPSPLLDDDARRELGGRLERPDAVARDRYLFYTTCTRAAQRLVLVREAAGDEGSPREPSPFWQDVRSLFDDAEVQRATRRRSLSALTWPLESAPSERERLRAVVRLAAEDVEGAYALAAANDWSRRLDRARGAFDRTTTLRKPRRARAVRRQDGLLRDRARALRRLLVGVALRAGDRPEADRRRARPDAARPGAAHDAAPLLRDAPARARLRARHAGEPRGGDRARAPLSRYGARVRRAARPHRRCRRQSFATRCAPISKGSFATRRRRTWASCRAGSRSRSDRSARRLSCNAVSSSRTTCILSGKIDRIDIDPFSARGIVQDYKSGKGAHSAREIDRELRLQIPLYILALRDLVGVEPLGGVYRALAGRRLTRGMLRESAREDLPGFARDDYLDEETFWAQVEAARERAADNAGRIRTGDVRHDPKGDGCPAWCDLWPMCRVSRA